MLIKSVFSNTIWGLETIEKTKVKFHFEALGLNTDIRPLKGRGLMSGINENEEYGSKRGG